jgi:hypothetical protein
MINSVGDYFLNTEARMRFAISSSWLKLLTLSCFGAIFLGSNAVNAHAFRIIIPCWPQGRLEIETLNLTPDEKRGWIVRIFSYKAVLGITDEHADRAAAAILGAIKDEHPQKTSDPQHIPLTPPTQGRSLDESYPKSPPLTQLSLARQSHPSPQNAETRQEAAPQSLPAPPETRSQPAPHTLETVRQPSPQSLPTPTHEPFQKSQIGSVQHFTLPKPPERTDSGTKPAIEPEKKELPSSKTSTQSGYKTTTAPKPSEPGSARTPTKPLASTLPAPPPTPAASPGRTAPKTAPQLLQTPPAPSQTPPPSPSPQTPPASPKTAPQLLQTPAPAPTPTTPPSPQTPTPDESQTVASTEPKKIMVSRKDALNDPELIELVSSIFLGSKSPKETSTEVIAQVKLLKSSKGEGYAMAFDSLARKKASELSVGYRAKFAATKYRIRASETIDDNFANRWSELADQLESEADVTNLKMEDIKPLLDEAMIISQDHDRYIKTKKTAR